MPNTLRLQSLRQPRPDSRHWGSGDCENARNRPTGSKSGLDAEGEFWHTPPFISRAARAVGQITSGGPLRTAWSIGQRTAEMQFLRRCGLAAIIGLVLAPSSASAAWSIWPFGDKQELPHQPAPTRQITGSVNRQVLDNNDPSIFSRLTSGPQRMVASTKNALSFGGIKRPTPTRVSGHSTKKKKKSSSGSMFGWLSPSEPEGPKTFDQWWDLKRPK